MIIVPGFPHDSLKGWDKVTKGRIVWARYLIAEGIAKNVIFSGSLVYTPCVESEVMAECAKAYGISDSVIYLETKAKHSAENVYYSYFMAKELGFQKIALATDPFQSKLVARFIKKRLADKVDLIPFDIDVLKTEEKPDPVLNLDSLIVSSFVPITEVESFWERLKGTRGLNINYENYPAP